MRTRPDLQARIAGLLYMLVIGASVFALVATSGLIAPGDATRTAANITASEQLFRYAFAANLLACVAYVAVVAILYEVLRPAGRALSVTAAFIGLAGCAVSGAGMSNQIAALGFLGDASAQSGFAAQQLHFLARASLRQSGLANSIALVFFGFYCLLLASLVFRSRFLPRILSVALTIAGLGWVIGSFSGFVAPSLGLASYLLPISGLGELLFTLWLLVMGVNADKWRAQASRI